MKQADRVLYLFARHISNEMSGEEAIEFENLLAKDHEFADLFEIFKRIQLVGCYDNSDHDEIAERFFNLMKMEFPGFNKNNDPGG